MARRMNRYGPDYESGYRPQGPEYRLDYRAGNQFEDWDEKERSGFMGMIRRRPLLAATVGAGAAYMVSRALRGSDGGQDARTSQRRSTATRHGTYLAWLNDAYATERSLVQVLHSHANDAKDHPELRSRLEAHEEQTRRHAEMVRGCIERLGGRPSSVKSGLATVMGRVHDMSMAVAKDKVVKNTLADYTSEHFEIASYKGLIAAAEEHDDQETARVCRQILDEETAMASWLEGQIPSTVKGYLRELHQQGGKSGSALTYDSEADRRYFEQHFETTFGSSGKRFNDYQNAYHYGAELAREPGTRDRTWHEVEPEAKRLWEQRHREPWEARKEAVRYGYNRGTMHVDEQHDIELGR